MSPDEDSHGLGGCRRSSAAAQPACATKHNFEATQEEEEEEDRPPWSELSGAVQGQEWGN